jgi:uncharacterized membrane protein YtjA (UPF0391 family)
VNGRREGTAVLIGRFQFAVGQVRCVRRGERGDSRMLKWALIFFVVSLIAGFFGFTNVAAGTRTIAKWLFFIAIVIFVLFLVLAIVAGEAIM